MNRPIRKFIDYEYPIGAVAIGYTLMVLGIASFFVTKSIILSLVIIIIGIYLARIFEQVRGRDRYVIKDIKEPKKNH